MCFYLLCLKEIEWGRATPVCTWQSAVKVDFYVSWHLEGAHKLSCNINTVGWVTGRQDAAMFRALLSRPVCYMVKLPQWALSFWQTCCGSGCRCPWPEAQISIRCQSAVMTAKSTGVCPDVRLSSQCITDSTDWKSDKLLQRAVADWKKLTLSYILSVVFIL